MKTKKVASMARALTAAAALAFSANTFAAGPLFLCDNGQPFLWPGGGANVPFNPDQGGLGILTPAEAVAAVETAYQAWQDVPSATIGYSNNGLLPVNVDVTNYGPFLNSPGPDGLSAIVFDDDGAIFADLFGPGSGILGFASPEWADTTTCEILEGYSFLNGPAINSLEGLLDLMVHEFGHYSNLAHVNVNGQLYIGVGETSGPNPDNTFGPAPNPDGAEIIATMYPFLFSNIDQISRTPNPDDVASISQLYPEPDFASSTGAIQGTIILGDTKVTGVNVIARNVADPFGDVVSAISSDFTDDFSQGNPITGLYTLRNLTPGADYAIYVDEILAGGFSTALASPLPGPEEFYSGALESADGTTDIPNVFEPVSVAAGGMATGIDVIFNTPQPGDPLNTGDDGNVQIPLPFEYCIAGKAYSSVYINGNGFITFGSPATGLTFIESAAAFTSGPPRIAAWWDDLNVTQGGSIFYEQYGDQFSVTWQDVPEFFSTGSNTVKITLTDNSDSCIDGKGKSKGKSKGGDGPDAVVEIVSLDSVDGLTGISAGTFATSGFEGQTDLSAALDLSGVATLDARNDTATYRQYVFDRDFDTAEFRYANVGEEYEDRFESGKGKGKGKRNDRPRKASEVELPFDTIPFESFSSISPEAADIDWYRLGETIDADSTVIAEILSGDVDTVMGLFYCNDQPGHEGHCHDEDVQLVAFNDDANGLLSRIETTVPFDGSYVLAVTFCCDYDFDGIDPGQGEPYDQGRYVLDAFAIDGQLLPLTDESFYELELGFDFPFQGNLYSSVFVNDNGYFTLGAGETFNFNPNVPELENGLPRVAPLWVDLDPGSGGMIIANGDAGSMTITYMGVPEYFFGGSNTMSMTIDASGGISFSYSGMTAPEGITGVAEGGGAPGTPVDLSSGGGFSATGTTYEEFVFGVSEFDLDGAALSFDP